MIPNIITAMRVILVGPIWWCLAQGTDQFKYYAAVIFLFAAFTDFLDGQAARRLKMVSQFGSMFDLGADRLLMTPTILIMYFQGAFDDTRSIFMIGPLIYVAMIVFVDMNGVIGIYLFTRLHKKDPTAVFPTPTISAKANFPVQILGVFFALLPGEKTANIAAGFMWAAMITTPVGYLTYVNKGSYVFRRSADLLFRRGEFKKI